MKKIVTVVLLMFAFGASAQDSCKFSIDVLSQLLNQYNHVDIINQDLAEVAKNEKWGIVDYSGKLITPLFDMAPRMNGNTIIVGNNDEDGGDILGLIDNKGNTLLPMKFKEILKLSDGMICVCDMNNKLGYANVNEEYKITIPCIYDYASNFLKGYAFVGNYGATTKYINKKGEEVDASILPNELKAGFEYGNAGNGYDVTISDSLGNTKVEHFDNVIDPGKESDYIMVVRNNKDGIVMSNGSYIPCIYDDIKTIHVKNIIEKGLVVVEKQGKWGVIDITGKQIIPCIYNEVFMDYNIICAIVNGKRKIFNNMGKPITSVLYDYAEPLGENAIHVKRHGKWELIDKNGKVLCADYYDAKREGDFIVIIAEAIENVDREDGVISMNVKPTKCYALDDSGNIVFTSESYPCPINKYFAEVIGDNGKAGVINNEGKIILPFEYDDLHGYGKRIFYNYGYFIVEKDGKQGFADTYGRSTFDK